MGRHQEARGRSGFSLLELMVAVVIIATLTTALTNYMAGALRARENVSTMLEDAVVRSFAAQVIERDLRLMVVPNGTLAGPMLGTSEEETGGYRNDTLEFYTASGALEESAPWGAVQRVEYTVDAAEADSPASGAALLRTVERNLLPNTEEEAEPSVVVREVAGLMIQYYESGTWADSWDSTAQDNATPGAVYLRIDFMPDETGSTPPPLEVFCELPLEAASTGVEGGVES